jgi:hypothetical protein
MVQDNGQVLNCLGHDGTRLQAIDNSCIREADPAHFDPDQLHWRTMPHPTASEHLIRSRFSVSWEFFLFSRVTSVHTKHIKTPREIVDYPMFVIRKLVVILALAGGVQTAAADEAADAVKTLSKLWKGNAAIGSWSQFVGDSKTFRMRTAGQTDDGRAYVITSEAPFKLLTIPDSSLSVIWEECLDTDNCVLVACLFARECIVDSEVEHAPVYRDPQRKATHYFKRAEEGGYVNPANAHSVRRALRTLIQLNAAPPFNPPAP